MIRTIVALALLLACGAPARAQSHPATPKKKASPKPAATTTPAPTPAPWTKEPDGYRGVKWGEQVADVQKRMELRVCLCGRVRPCPKPGTDPAEAPPVRTCRGLFIVGGHTPLKERWLFARDAFGGTSFTFDSDSFDTMRDIFVERYGPPTETSESIFEARGGAKVPNHTLTWAGKDVTITLSRFGSSLSEGEGAVMTNAMVVEQKKESEEAAREGAKAF